MVTKKQNQKIQSGFTLIELLVVIAIIGLLAAVVLVALTSSRQKAQDAKRVADVQQLAKAVELYYPANNTYPVATTPTTTIPGVIPQYVAAMPAPPQPPGNGCTTAQNNYTYQSDGQSYGIVFCTGTTVGTFKPNYYIISSQGIQLRYDINGDGVFDSNDPSYISQYMVHLQASCPLAKCDISGDGTVSSYDASLLAIILSNS